MKYILSIIFYQINYIIFITENVKLSINSLTKDFSSLNEILEFIESNSKISKK